MEEDTGDKRKKRSTYNKKRYEENKEQILSYRKERYKLLKQRNTKVEIECGDFVLMFE